MTTHYRGEDAGNEAGGNEPNENHGDDDHRDSDYNESFTNRKDGNYNSNDDDINRHYSNDDHDMCNGNPTEPPAPITTPPADQDLISSAQSSQDPTTGHVI